MNKDNSYTLRGPNLVFWKRKFTEVNDKHYDYGRDGTMRKNLYSSHYKNYKNKNYKSKQYYGL